MKIRLPFLPRFAPKWLVTLAKDGNIVTYRIRMSWHGKYHLALDTMPPGQKCIVVVGHELPFRRKLQRIPDTTKSQLAMLKAAVDEFPLPAEEMHYGLGMHGNDGYLYALPRKDLDILDTLSLSVEALLVSGSGLNMDSALEALENYFKYGKNVDLLQRKAPLSKHRLLQVLLSSLLVVLLTLILVIAALPNTMDRLLEWKIAPLREKGSALPKLLRTTQKMVDSHAEATRLYASPEARFPSVMAKIFNTVPKNHSISSIDFKDNILSIRGTGSDVYEWLEMNGFNRENITVEEIGKFKRFSAKRDI